MPAARTSLLRPLLNGSGGGHLQKVGVARVHARPFLRVVGRLSLGKFKWRMLGESFRIESVNVYRTKVKGLPAKGCRLTATTEFQVGQCSDQNPHPCTKYGRPPL